VYKGTGSCTPSVKRQLGLCFVGVQEGWQASLTFIHWPPSDLLSHTTLRPPSKGSSCLSEFEHLCAGCKCV